MIAMSAEQVHECLADAGSDIELIKQLELARAPGTSRLSFGCLGIIAACCRTGFTRNRRNRTSRIT